MGITVDGKTYIHLQKDIMLELDCLHIECCKCLTAGSVCCRDQPVLPWLLRGGVGRILEEKELAIFRILILAS